MYIQSKELEVQHLGLFLQSSLTQSCFQYVYLIQGLRSATFGPSSVVFINTVLFSICISSPRAQKCKIWAFFCNILQSCSQYVYLLPWFRSETAVLLNEDLFKFTHFIPEAEFLVICLTSTIILRVENLIPLRMVYYLDIFTLNTYQGQNDR